LRKAIESHGLSVERYKALISGKDLPVEYDEFEINLRQKYAQI